MLLGKLFVKTSHCTAYICTVYIMYSVHIYMYICASVKTFKLNKFLGEICKNLIEVPPISRRLAPHPETSCSSSTDDRRGRKGQGCAFEKE